MSMERIAAIVTAGGASRRFGGPTPKQFAALQGKPVLAYALSVFNDMDEITEVVVTVPPGYVTTTRRDIVEAMDLRKVNRIIEGGGERQLSVYKALQSLPTDTDIVLVHDGVRPFVTARTIHAVIACVRQGNAAVAGVKTTDTVKITAPDGRVTATPERTFLWNAQTPQGFTYKTLLTAHQQAIAEGFTAGTDDAMLVERAQLADVYMVESDRYNIKITTPEDIVIGESVHRHRKRQKILNDIKKH